MKVDSTAALRAELDRCVETFERGELGQQAAAVAGLLLARLAAGVIVVKRGDEAAALLRVLVDVARIEAGEHTSATLVGHVSTSDAVARVVELRERARLVLLGAAGDELSAAAVAGEDVDDVEAGSVVVVVDVDPAGVALGGGSGRGGVAGGVSDPAG